MAGNSCGAENLGRSDTEGLEQFGELVVEAGAELGDGRVGEAGKDGARLVDGEITLTGRRLITLPDPRLASA